MSWKPTLGTFSKGRENSIALNFGQSGGKNCSPKCQALKRGVCYAVHTERLKPSIAVSGERKEQAGFYECCLSYRLEIHKLKKQGKPIPWIRFSTFGSVPNRPLRPHEIAAFVSLVRSFPGKSPVHFPVETRQKRDRFKAILWAHGLQDRLEIRLSCQSDKAMMEEFSAGNAASRIVSNGATKRERLANAQKLAKRLGPGARVCPAIASTVLRRPRPVKCGDCTLCAQFGGMILYPEH